VADIAVGIALVADRILADQGFGATTSESATQGSKVGECRQGAGRIVEPVLDDSFGFHRAAFSPWAFDW